MKEIIKPSNKNKFRSKKRMDNDFFKVLVFLFFGKNNYFIQKFMDPMSGFGSKKSKTKKQ